MEGFSDQCVSRCVREPRTVPRDESRFLRDLWFPNPFQASVHQVTTISETDGFDQESHVYNLEPP